MSTEKTTVTEPREYVVLMAGAEHTDHSPTWIEVGRAKALTRDEALDEIVDGLAKDGPFVAVAARYFQPTLPDVQTVVKRSWK
jgi:hypothetical protein